MKNHGRDIVELSLLATTIIVVLGLFIRSLITGEDIPQGWALLIGSAWGALLGVKELLKKGGKGDGSGSA
jgi:hypothetical protein